MDLIKMMQTGEGVEQLKEKLLGLDSEFRFKCRKCGKCCVHQDTILLNARDIYNIARKKGMTMQQVVDSYTEVYVGSNSRVPVVHLLPNGPKRACPLLEDKRCSVHDCKPTVCALFPLGRVIGGDDFGAPIEDLDKLQVEYFLNHHDCGSAKRVNTVRGWLTRFGIPEHDEFFLLWNKVQITLAQMIRKMEKENVSAPTLSMFWEIIYQTLYLQYDTAQDFAPQFQAAADKLLRLSKEIINLAASTVPENE